MRKILITGKDSYIGTNFKKYLEQYPDDYYVEELDVKENSWRYFDFSEFDVVFHVAGIAHIKENIKNENLYYEVNRDLALEVAKQAKVNNVKQFIFMSSMSVYGLKCSKENITNNTLCIPNTYYGKSKYQAEKLLAELESTDFEICIVRPPMVYSDDSPGNLSKLFKVVRKVHVFPTFRNQRSSIKIDYLCMFIKNYIDNNTIGICFPQNEKYMCTVDIVKHQMEKERVKVVYVSLFNPIIKLLIKRVSLISKCFGDLKYEKE